MIPFSFRLLGFFWAYHLLFLPSAHITQYFCWISSHIILGFLSPFYSFGHPWPISFGHSQPVSFLWAFSARFIPWGILGPSHSFLLLTFPLAFAKIFRASPAQLLYPLLLGLLAFELSSFTNSFLWATLAHLCLLSTSYDSHGLTTSLFGAPLGPFVFFGAFLLFCGLVYHYSCHSGLMVFSYFANSSFFTSFILLDFFLPLEFLF